MTHPTRQDARMGDTTAAPKTHARYGGPTGKLLCGRTGVRDAVLARQGRSTPRKSRTEGRPHAQQG